MTVYCKLAYCDGTVGKKVDHGCWGFLKRSFKDSYTAYKKQTTDKAYEDNARYMRNYGHTPDSEETYMKKKLKSFIADNGVTPDVMKTGLSSIIICNLALGTAEGKALLLIVSEYPDLFKGITKIDVKKSEITVTTDQHYAALYNQLRVLSGYYTLEPRVTKAIMDNPDLSIFLHNLYKQGDRALGSSTIFRADILTPDAIKEFTQRRAWVLSEEDAIYPRFNALTRQSCAKIRSTSYAEITQPLNGSRYVTNWDSKYHIPNDYQVFIKEVRDAAA